jgi:bifunctional ADP-heptose synthase (sugar kinase/adenylyltransferase)
VIVATDSLGGLGARVTMVDGGFDPLPVGHIAYFRAARELGDPVLCNISSDEWVARKHPPLLRQAERAVIIDAIRFVDYVHVSQTSTANVLALLRPARYAKGGDWRDRLPEEELAVCREHGIGVVFLDTVTDSSTAILARFRNG